MIRYFHHGSFSKISVSELLEAIRSSLENAQTFLQKTNRLLLTLGSAYVYIHRELGEVVANNHKLPASAFNRRRLGVSEITAALRPLFQRLKGLNPKLEVDGTCGTVLPKTSVAKLPCYSPSMTYALS